MSASAPRGRRYAGKTMDERRRERRERLLDAGLELFGTRGYAQTTIEQLCALARLNPRYFYEQFTGREELLGAVYERHVAAVAEVVTRSVEQAVPEPRARLEAGLRAFLDGTLADERAARINYFEVVGVSPALEARRRGALAAYADLVTAQIGALAPELRRALSDPRRAAVALVGATDGLIIDWLTGERAGGPEEILNTLLEVFAPLLTPGAPELAVAAALERARR